MVQVVEAREDKKALPQRAAGWSVASNIALVAIKLAGFLVSGSVSVLAESINSAADLIGSTVSLLSVRAADAPPDELHAYGHGKFENLSGVVIGVFVLGGAGYAVYEAIEHLEARSVVARPMPAMAVMAVSFIVNFAVATNLLRVGKAADSPALIADGRHRTSDVWSSLGVFASLILVRFTHLRWIDPAVALAVSGVILWVGFQIAKDSLLTLADTALPLGEEEALRATLESDPRVLGFHALRTRKSGSHRYVDVHVQIADSHTFVGAHELSEELEDKLRKSLPNLHPIIHIEPYEAEKAHQRTEHGVKPHRRSGS